MSQSDYRIDYGQRASERASEAGKLPFIELLDAAKNGENHVYEVHKCPESEIELRFALRLTVSELCELEPKSRKFKMAAKSSRSAKMEKIMHMMYISVPSPKSSSVSLYD